MIKSIKQTKMHIVCLMMLIFLPSTSFAEQKLVTNAEYAMLIDSETGAILHDGGDCADKKMWPASMTKVMTAYIAFEAIESGEMKLEDKIVISEKAWKMSGSRMFLQAGKIAKVDDVLKGLIVVSGNDAAVAIAEAIEGTEEEFVRRMNMKAKELGMLNTNFVNASGWPNEEHFSTPRDMLKLARAMIKNFPEFYRYHALREFSYGGITQRNRNFVIGDLCIDGIKTGYTDKGGYGVLLSAEKDGFRVIGIVNGLKSEIERKEASIALINYGLKSFEKEKFYSNGEEVCRVEVPYGQADDLALLASGDISGVKYKFKKGKCLSAINIEVPKELKAPVKKGQVVGRAFVSNDNIAGEVIVVDLVAADDVKKCSFFVRMKRNISKLVGAEGR